MAEPKEAGVPMTKEREEAVSKMRPPKRRRENNAFNIFCQGKTKREGETVGTQFKRFGTQWKSLTEDQKAAFKLEPRRPKPVDKESDWKKQMEYAVNELNYCNHILPTPSVLLYVCPLTGIVRVAGTDEGNTFIQKNPYIVSRFEVAMADAESHKPEKIETSVRTLFNKLFSVAAGIEGAKLPYKYITECGITINGLDELELPLKNPALYGKKQMKLILQNAENLSCEMLWKEQLPEKLLNKLAKQTMPTKQTARSRAPSTVSTPPPSSPAATTSHNLAPSSPAPPPSSSAPPPSSSTATTRKKSATSSASSAPPPSSSSAITTSKKSSKTVINIQHPDGSGYLQAPATSTHVLLNAQQSKIRAACVKLFEVNDLQIAANISSILLPDDELKLNTQVYIFENKELATINK